MKTSATSNLLVLSYLSGVSANIMSEIHTSEYGLGKLVYAIWDERVPMLMP